MPPSKLQAVSLFDEQSERISEIEAFKSGRDSLLNFGTREGLLRVLRNHEVGFFAELEKTIKSGSSQEQIINFVLKGIANGDINSNALYKLNSYSTHCHLLESFGSLPPEICTPAECRKAINNKEHDIWFLLTECTCTNARILHMKNPNRSNSGEENERLNATIGLQNEIRLRHRTKKIEKSNPQKTGISRPAIKQVFVTIAGFVGRY
jgi:hypothetical protein